MRRFREGIQKAEKFPRKRIVEQGPQGLDVNRNLGVVLQGLDNTPRDLGQLTGLRVGQY